LPIRLVGAAADGVAGRGLGLQTCDGAPVDLAAGTHELRAAPGADTAVDLDRLVLTTPSWATAGQATPRVAPAVAVGHVGTTSVTGTAATDGSPFWVVLDQSMNEGWKLRVDGARVEGPRPVDSYAAGWLVTPDGPGTLELRARWEPQRVVDLALLASVVGVLGCLALVVAGRRRSPTPTGPVAVEAALLAPRRARSPLDRGSVGVALGTGVLAGLVVHPLAAAPAAALALLATSRPTIGRFLPAALLVTAAAQVIWFQHRDGHPIDREWPQWFGGAHVAAMLAVLLLAAGAVADVRSGRRRASTNATATGDRAGPPPPVT
jgi:hypothetical protein